MAPGQSIGIHGHTLELKGDARSSGSKSKYFLVTLEGFSPGIQSAIQTAGADILSYIDETVFLCHIPPVVTLDTIHSVPGVNLVDEYPQNIKITKSLQSNIEKKLKEAGKDQPSHEGNSGGGPSPGSAKTGVRVRIQIYLHKNASASDGEEVVKRIKTLDDAASSPRVFPGMINVEMDTSHVADLSKMEIISSIWPWRKRKVRNHFATEVLDAIPCGFEGNQSPFTGKGEKISICDTGFNDGNPLTAHDAFLTKLDPRHSLFCMEHTQAVPDCNKDVAGHGTHVSGSALGNSRDLADDVTLGDIYIKGTAPEAQLMMTQLLSEEDEEAYSGSIVDIYNKTFAHGARIFSDSWDWPKDPDEATDGYLPDVEASDTRIMRSNLLVCFCAGNERDDAVPGIVGTNACAKNVVTVGACFSSRPVGFHPPTKNFLPSRDSPPGDIYDVATFSNWQTEYGRLKPDVVAPGVCILSARSSCMDAEALRLLNRDGASEDIRYCFMTGTSMSTALVAGCAAVLSQALRARGRNSDDKFAGVLIKALLINGAVPLEQGQYIKGDDRPWGWGRVNLRASLGHIHSHRGKHLRQSVSADIEWGISPSYEVEIAPGTELDLTGETLLSSIKITLVWADIGNQHLITQLYLTLTKEKTGEVWFGNHEGWVSKEDAADDPENPSKLDQYRDDKNNVQQIMCTGLEEGKYRIRVTFYRTIFGDIQKVPFAVAWDISDASCSTS